MAPEKANVTDSDLLYRLKLQTRFERDFFFFGMFLTINSKLKFIIKDINNSKDND